MWLNRCEEVVDLTGADTPISDFINELMGVREHSMTPEFIISAFRKAGIAPFSPGIFKDTGFAPSQSSLMRGHLPSSFPDHKDDMYVDIDGSDDKESDSGLDTEDEMEEGHDEEDEGKDEDFASRDLRRLSSLYTNQADPRREDRQQIIAERTSSASTTSGSGKI
jgi:hypothetical protein